jgi:hypothetical protein
MTSLLKIWEFHYNSDFAAGVRLLANHDGERLLTKLTFQRLQVLAVSGSAPDAYNLGKLTGALAKIEIGENYFPEPIEQPVKKVFVAPSVQVPDASSPITSAKAKALHKEQAHHHALMVAADNDNERGEHAGEILRISKDLDTEYDRLRAQLNPGIEEELEPAPSPKPEQSAADLRRLNSLRSRSAHIRNKLLPKASGKRLADLEKELEKKAAEIQRLENQLA